MSSSVLTGCGGSGGGGGTGCELVTEGESFLKMTNHLNTGLRVYLEQFAFGADMRPGVCEIYGMPAGSVSVELTQCNLSDDGGCPDLFGPTRTISFSVAEGETHDIVVTADLF
jgi:hypothetical protein